eukprot:TRINITY_DN13626_c0_g1_i1.p1 TRINITY_DN13626_c0_g1~~TRINITY_DN13626_c0_g1_i1.p1  ORF type:complete len:413 (-),score=34.69 TRINITY_DN13626_c0_g1_i1:56-1294(-)
MSDSDSQILLQEQSNESPEPNTGTLPSAVINLVNAGIGGGILTIPIIFASSGILGGFLLIIIISLTMAYSNYILLKFASRSGRSVSSYEDLIHVWLSPWASVFVNVTFVLGLTFACASMLIIVGDALEPLFLMGFGEESWVASRYFFTAVCVVLIFPLTLLKKITYLKYTSTFSTLVYLVLSLSIVYKFVVYVSEHGVDSDKIVYVNFSWKFVESVPLVIFSFICNVQSIPVFQEMEVNTSKRAVSLVLFTTTVFTIIYGLIGIGSYFMFYARISGNILLQFPDTDIMMNIVRVGIALATVCTYPLLSYPLRLSVDFLLSYCMHLEKGLMKHRTYLFSAVLLITTYLIACIVRNLVDIVSLISSVLLPFSLFILPGMMQMKNRESSSDTIGAIWVMITGMLALASFTTLFLK